MLIVMLIITGAAIVVSLLSGKSELYDIGVNLLATGVALTVLVIPFFYRSHHRARTRINLHLSVEERNKSVSDPYYDYFAGVAFAPIAAAILGFLLVILANSIGQRPASNANIPFVGSVQPHVIKMQEIAHQHYEDAYLVELMYNFGQQTNYILSTEFAIPSHPSLGLVIELSIDGEYIEETYEVPTHLSSPIPITKEDWPIDSQKAIWIFAQDDGLKTCIVLSQEYRKLLELTRAYSIDQDEVKWCLRIDGCEATQTRTCINAATGEKIIFKD